MQTSPTLILEFCLIILKYIITLVSLFIFKNLGHKIFFSFFQSITFIKEPLAIDKKNQWDASITHNLAHWSKVFSAVSFELGCPFNFQQTLIPERTTAATLTLDPDEHFCLYPLTQSNNHLSPSRTLLPIHDTSSPYCFPIHTIAYPRSCAYHQQQCQAQISHLHPTIFLIYVFIDLVLYPN